MNCENCSCICCTNMPIYVMDIELKGILEVKPDLEVNTFGNIHFISPPCPFFYGVKGEIWSNGCSIYEIRPSSCKWFPMMGEWMKDVERMGYYILNSCPKSEELTFEDKKDLLDYFYVDQALQALHPPVQTLKQRNKERIYKVRLAGKNEKHFTFFTESARSFRSKVKEIMDKMSGE